MRPGPRSLRPHGRLGDDASEVVTLIALPCWVVLLACLVGTGCHVANGGVAAPFDPFTESQVLGAPKSILIGYLPNQEQGPRSQGRGDLYVAYLRVGERFGGAGNLNQLAGTQSDLTDPEVRGKIQGIRGHGRCRYYGLPSRKHPRGRGRPHVLYGYEKFKDGLPNNRVRLSHVGIAGAADVGSQLALGGVSHLSD